VAAVAEQGGARGAVAVTGGVTRPAVEGRGAGPTDTGTPDALMTLAMLLLMAGPVVMYLVLEDLT
jgi:hypothetical protein